MKNKLLMVMAVLAIAFTACKDSGDSALPPQEKQGKIVSPIALGTVKKSFDSDSIMVYLLTEQQYEDLVDTNTFSGYKFLDLEETTTFGPVKNCYGEWIITQEELNMCNIPELSWVFNLPTKGYCFPDEIINP